MDNERTIKEVRQGVDRVLKTGRQKYMREKKQETYRIAAITENDYSETCYYVTMVFQRNEDAMKFIERMKNEHIARFDDQVFIDGYAVADLIGLDIKYDNDLPIAPMKHKNAKAMEEIGFYGE